MWNTAQRIHKATESELALVLSCRGEYVVKATGVHVKVGSTRIGYGARSALLRPFVGRKVLVCVDPDKPASAWAYTAEGEKRKIIGQIPPNEKISPEADTETLREAMAEVQRERRVMKQAQRASPKRTRTAVQRVNQHAQERRIELMATGTDDGDPKPSIVPVRTSFEGVSIPDQRAIEEPEKSEYDDLDLSALLYGLPRPEDAGDDDDPYEIIDYAALEASVDDDDDENDEDGVEQIMEEEPTADDDDEEIGGVV